VLYVQNEVVSNHDELMCNFFAQADALANGKSEIELRAEQVPEYLVPHKTFTGNRPSLSVLLPDCTAYTVGQLLALYELRIGVQVGSSICIRLPWPCQTDRGACLVCRPYFPAPTKLLCNGKV
jgi:glucose-6-phosphate isomerase